MPRDLADHAKCTIPGSARSHKNFSGLLGLLVRGWFTQRGFTIVGILAVLVPLIIVLPCTWVIPFTITVVALLQQAKDWYYHERLLCVDRSPNCVVGTVLHEPSVSTDGDRKLDLLLAPYTEPEGYRSICTHVMSNRVLLNTPSTFQNPPFFNGVVPVAPPTCDPDILEDPSATPNERRAERQKLTDYLRAIRGADPEDGDATSNPYNSILIGWMDRLLDPSNVDGAGQPKNFQGRYYRKDPAFIAPGSALWDAIPTDFDPNTAWQAPDGSMSPVTYQNPYEVQHQPRGLNPMFRFDETRLLPYLHSEIDGYRIAVLLDRLCLSLSAFAIAYTFSCLLLGPWALLIGPLAFLLIWFLQWLLDGGSDAGNAEETDVEYDDPDNFGEEGQQLDGDLVSLYGRWIMDTEHAQYFEIHPVQAYYVIGRDADGGLDPFDSAKELEEAGSGRLDNSMIDLAARDEICRLVTEGEEGELPPVIEKTGPTLLSHGLVTRWGGGGVTVD